jgi:hypothetical protein
LSQNGKWVVRMDCRTSDTGNTPAGRQSGPKVFVVRYAERGNLMPSPFVQANRRHAVGGTLDNLVLLFHTKSLTKVWQCL